MGGNVVPLAHVDVAKRAWASYSKIRQSRETWLKAVARRTYRHVIQGVADRHPRVAPLWVYLAWLDLDAGEPVQAVQMAEAALRVEPSNAEAIQLLSWLRSQYPDTNPEMPQLRHPRPRIASQG